jgi:amino acid transporter
MAEKIIVALVAFIVSIALAFVGLNYANNLNTATEGISIFFALFIGVWLSTFIE